MIAGIVPFFLMHIIPMIEAGARAKDIPFLISQAIVHLGWNGIWGVIFGLFISIIFDRIPGRVITKGLLIGLIYALFSTFQPVCSLWAYGNVTSALIFLLGGPQDKFIFGILFTYLYKPPK